MAVSEPTLVDQVLNGENPNLRRLAAQGLLPLAPGELIPLQVKLARSGDPELAEVAAKAILATEPKLVADFVAVDASPEDLTYFAAHAEHPLVLEEMIRRRDVSRLALVDAASRLEPALQEILILRQDAIVDEPSILDALERNPRLDVHVGRRILEYRQHLLPREKPAKEPSEPEEESGPEGVASEKEVREAIARVAQEPSEGDVEESTGLSEGQIRMLPVPVRLQLSRNAPRSLRGILVRDSNAIIAVSVVENNPLSDEEVEQIARNRSIIDDVLEAIARRREWAMKRPIVNALVCNPRTPAGLAIRLMPRLGIRELRSLSFNRNVATGVRNRAKQLYHAKTR